MISTPRSSITFNRRTTTCLKMAARTMGIPRPTSSHLKPVPMIRRYSTTSRCWHCRTKTMSTIILIRITSWSLISAHHSSRFRLIKTVRTREEPSNSLTMDSSKVRLARPTSQPCLVSQVSQPSLVSLANPANPANPASLVSLKVRLSSHSSRPTTNSFKSKRGKSLTCSTCSRTKHQAR